MRRARCGFGQHEGSRWRKYAETASGVTYTLAESGIGRCGTIRATLHCRKRPSGGRVLYGRPFSCSGELTYTDPHTGRFARMHLRAIPAKTFSAAVESAMLEADFQFERLRSRCYTGGGLPDPKWPEFSPGLGCCRVGRRGR